ncbi:PVC-type heme-binding CxxCH protein [Planctomicrobium piriforme]|uniref:Putative membrane-bound dehydrogenase domain-containing protein n=1 Tax=Planctomicrobium piriforme TaxID=1576369 RepID=A0A1I3H0E3_9PLAN|nr:PVC-type heme-binding CxxCH protein [Planctomicrobium piriforme]SFI29214.1 putative membrane-bound dehydrogenase domain-containing protein [Planctomicrobium piriforme]
MTDSTWPRLGRLLRTAALCLIICGPSLFAEDFAAELPRIPPLEPDAALSRFEVAPGYAIQLMAAEPLVVDPVAMCYDENGRLYVAEMCDYSEQETERLGRIQLLEDLDQDGRFEKSTTFATGLSWPTALICYDGGIFVGAAPDIHYMKDASGDGIADESRVVFTGFGRSNVQGLLNSFRWGLDNRIHGATSVSGGEVKRADQPHATPLNLRGRDFSFDPKTLELRPESGGGQHGLCFDDWGRKFVCSNSEQASFIVYQDRYIARNPYLSAIGPKVDIGTDSGQTPVFRSSPVEPWRIVRTRLRASGAAPGHVEWGGQPAGYFTAATGITIFRGDALGDELRGVAIVGDVGSNIIHRMQVTPKGVAFVVSRIDQNTEFVRSSDIWFRPVQFDNAPDGCLHVLDMYREVIEHPKSLPPQVKNHLDLTSGRDRGRLYRVLAKGSKYRPTPQLSTMSSADLVALLSHDNAWHRETASRLLSQRQDLAVVPALRTLAITGEKPLGRLHGLSVLNGLNQLDADVVESALADSHPRIRERALQYAEAFATSPDVIRKVGSLISSDDPRLRLQLAFSAGEFPAEQKVAWLTTLLQRPDSDKWLQLAAVSSLSNDALPVFSNLLQNPNLRRIMPADSILQRLTLQIARQNKAGDVDVLLTLIEKLPASEQPFKDQLITTLLTSSSPSTLKQVFIGPRAELIETMLASARNKVSQPTLAVERISAIRILALSAQLQDVERLQALLAPTEEVAIQTTALGALAATANPNLANALLDRWNEFSPSMRLKAEEVLFSRPDWTAATLTLLESGGLAPSAFSTARLRTVAAGNDVELQRRANLILNSLGTASRAEIVQRYLPALTQSGDTARGREIFRKQCSGCHRLEGVGNETGPNLSAIRNRGKEAILLNVLDPNREVNPDYLNYIVSLQDGRTLTGMIRSETATSLTLVRAENQSSTVLRNEIEQIRNSGQSLMPEGLERQIDEQAMADLLAYLLSPEALR